MAGNASLGTQIGAWKQALVVVVILAWSALELWLQHNALSVRSDGVWAGHLNIWSDWPFHLAMSGLFADRSPSDWFVDHPMFAGEPLRYPFAVNLLSGLLLRAGLGTDAAMTLPTLVAGIATPGILFLLFRSALSRGTAAALATTLFFLGAGFGGFFFLVDIVESGSWSALLYPEYEVSRMDRYDWYSGNVLTGMLLPQRAFVLGLPVALLSLWLLLRAVTEPSGRRTVASVSGGALAGLLPVVHTHSYIALALIGVAVAVLHPKAWRSWLPFAFVAASAGGIWGSTLLSVEQTEHLRWDPGFSAPEGFAAWLLMWLRLWGLALPATILALPLLGKSSLSMRSLALGGLFCFVFANLILIQPNRWDNSKMFLWTYLCWSPLWSALAVRLWQSSLGAIGRLLSVGLVAGLTFTGVLEIARLANTGRSQSMIANSEDVQFAQLVRSGTPPLSVFLTDTAHNHPIMAFGARPIFLGFTGWMANFGFDHSDRETAVKTIYAGGSEAMRLLHEYDIDFVVVGPAERTHYHPNEAWFSQNFASRFENRDFRIYDARSTEQSLP